MKKMKNTEVFVINQAAPIDGLLKTEDEHASDWAGESSECKCNVNDDLQEMDGINCCGAKSKCKKLRRNRTVFTELQLMGLERRFDSQKYLSTPDRYVFLIFDFINNRFFLSHKGWFSTGTWTDSTASQNLVPKSKNEMEKTGKTK